MPSVAARHSAKRILVSFSERPENSTQCRISNTMGAEFCISVSSQKYEDIYLNDYQTMTEPKDGLKRYFEFYNGQRFHASLDYVTPRETYAARFPKDQQTHHADA